METASRLAGRFPRLARYEGDIVGGLVSAGVAIPLAMGYGMFAFTVLGNDYFPDGALAGLVTATILGFVCVALGDKSANVYAPRVTTTFFLGLLLYGLVNSSAAVLKSGGVAVIIPVLFAIILLAGVFQALFGLTRLGTLIRFIPQPVMSGFQNAAAVILVLVQLGNLFGFDRSTTFTQALRDAHHARPLSLLIAAVAIAAMLLARKRLPKVPALLVGLGGRHRPLLRAGPGGARHPHRPHHRQRALQFLQAAQLPRFRGAGAAAGDPGAGADHRRRRARARRRRLDRRTAVRQAAGAARRGEDRRRPAAGAARRRQYAHRRLRRHHRRLQHRAEPGQQGVRRPDRAFPRW